MVFGLICAVVLAQGSVLKAIAMIVLGLLLSMVGPDSRPARDARPSASPNSPMASVSRPCHGLFGLPKSSAIWTPARTRPRPGAAEDHS